MRSIAILTVIYFIFLICLLPNPVRTHTLRTSNFVRFFSDGIRLRLSGATSENRAGVIDRDKVDKLIDTTLKSTGAVQTYQENKGGTFNELSTAAQLTLEASTLASVESSIGLLATVTTAKAALGFGLAKLGRDFQNGTDENSTTKLGDGLSVIGDATAYVGQLRVTSQLPEPN